MRVRVLGSAAGGGLPQWNCGGELSTRARRGDPQVPPRSQPSIAVTSGDQRWSLVNASPDVRDQLARFPGLHPRPGTRDIPLDTVVLTNPDLDHVMGLLVMRESLPYRVVTSAWIRDLLMEHNAVFRLIAPAFGVVALDEPFPLDRKGVLEAKLFPAPGKVPSWAKDLARNSAEATLALRITDTTTGRRLVYAPGLQSLGPGTLAELERADLRFVDGTFYTPHELRAMRPGAPDATSMGHLPISGSEGSLERLRGLPGRTLYIHLNNTNPVLDAGSGARAAVERAGIEVAMDGMELEV